MKTNLQRHYEQKYAHETNETADEIIALQKFPTTRYEAALKFIPRFFQDGNILELGAGNGIVARALLDSELAITSYTLSDLSVNRINGVRARR